MTKTILVVDDSESIRELIASTLENAGYKVFRGINGKDGYEKLQAIEDHISLVITDLFMPEMDGLQFINAIRSGEEYKYIPILMLTTESQLERKLEGKKAGVTGWMVKPFQEDKLLRTVRKILR